MKTLFDLTEPPAPPYNDYHTDPDWWERRRTDSEINAIVDQQMKIAKAWAVEIRAAYLARKECPIVPTPQYQHVFAIAGQLAFGGASR